ncbi:MAG TPA: XisH family protein [Nostocaceae cyanobacterium]|nr:XisH family protein [Nostocaceae cyanobacterium]
MAAKDLYHDAVKQALLKDEWAIVADPLKIKIGRIKLEIDLAADRVVAADKAGQKIAVEIKSFLSSSVITDFHAALGQFLNYRLALQMTEPDRILYLAVPLDTFNLSFHETLIQEAIKIYQVKIIVYNQSEEVITEWID